MTTQPAGAHGGVPELLDEGKNGLMVPSEDPQALAEGLQSALGRTWDAQALRDTVQFLSWDAVADSYYSILSDAVADRRGAQNSARAACTIKEIGL